jgi:hypothetical protein
MVPPGQHLFEGGEVDAHLDDGSTVTVEFHTKPPYVSPKAPLTPFVLITLTDPDGRRLDRTYIADAAKFAASEHECDVTIGRNTFRGDSGKYTIHVEIDEVTADFTLHPELSPWRPETAHVFFGAQHEHYIAWLPIVARGAVDAVITRDGHTETWSGSGYHDHNWGNIAPRKVLHHWYWGRACVGDYTAVTLMFVSHDKYDNAVLPKVMIAKDSEIVGSAVGADQIAFSAGNIVEDADTAVPVARRLEYRVRHADSVFRVTFEHRRDAYTLDFGAAGAYLRFIGDVTIEHDAGGRVFTASGQTLWELLYFGEREDTAHTSNRPPVIIGHQA